MLAEEDLDGFAILKPHDCVLPVTDVVSKTYVEHRVAQVVAVKEEPKCIYNAVGLWRDDKNDRRITSSAMVARERRAKERPLAQFRSDLCCLFIQLVLYAAVQLFWVIQRLI